MRDSRHCGRRAPRSKLDGKIAVVRSVSYEKHEASPTPIDGGVRLIRTGAVQRELVVDRDLLWVPPERVAPAKMLRRGDVVMAISSSVALAGKTALLRDDWEGTIGAFCSIIRPLDGVVPEYLALWFRSPQYEAWRPANVRATTNIANVNVAQLHNVEIPLPSKDDQIRFAHEIGARVTPRRDSPMPTREH